MLYIAKIDNMNSDAKFVFVFVFSQITVSGSSFTNALGHFLAQPDRTRKNEQRFQENSVKEVNFTKYF